jgi:hypothetical protein
MKTFKTISDAKKPPQERPGGSNVGKYTGVKSFCGPSGKAPAGSYPVNSCARTKSAKKLAHNAPNPAGIKSCAERAAKRMGCK